MPEPATAPTVVVLLAVDIGLRFGLAEFDAAGRLVRYSSRHAANRTVLRRAVEVVLSGLPALRHVVLEGGGPLAEQWARAAGRRGIGVLQTTAEHWRGELLLSREQRTGQQAKRVADGLARELIRRHGARAPTSLRHDAAEAILLGAWACPRLGLRDGAQR
jgi:hypothetical protein